MAREGRYVSGNLAVEEQTYEYEYPVRRRQPYRSESAREQEQRLALQEQELARQHMAARQQQAQRRHKNRVKLVIRTMAAILLVAGVCIAMVAGQLVIVRNNRAIARKEAELAEAVSLNNDLTYQLALEENLQQVEVEARELGMVYAADGETHTVTLPDVPQPQQEPAEALTLWQKLRQFAADLF